MKLTSNYELKKPEVSDAVNIDDLNYNTDIVDVKIKEAMEKANQAFQSASNGKSIIAGAITGKGVPTSANDTFTVMASNIDSIVTDPSIGTTDATASDVLAPKKVVSQGNLLTGTMPNRGAVNQNLTTEGQEYTIPSGYHNGLGKVKAVITGLVASVIKAGTTVGGVLGTFTSDATATAAQMLSGAIAYVNGNKITGTIPSKSAQTYTPGTTNQTIAAGSYLSGVQTIEGSANLIPENIKDGVNIFGKIGNYNNSGMSKVTSDSFQCARLQSSSGGFGSVSGFSLAIANYATETVNNILFIIEGGSSIRFRLTSGTPVLIRRITNESTGGSFAGQITNLLESPESGIGSSSFLVYNPDKQPIDIYRYYSGGNMFVYKLIV